ncbi:MAG: hypothetical protein AAF623_01340, partial [Planctomycetota bacterium]
MSIDQATSDEGSEVKESPQNENQAAESTSLTQQRNEVPMIEADRLSKFYGIFAATREVSFKVYKGEVVAFLGPNGAG